MPALRVLRFAAVNVMVAVSADELMFAFELMLVWLGLAIIILLARPVENCTNIEAACARFMVSGKVR